MNPSSYQEIKNFIQANPLTYKRVKRDLKKFCSNKDSYRNLKRIYLTQQKVINSMNKKHYSTYSNSNLKLNPQDRDFL